MRKALVTGGSRGIGRAIVEQLRKAEYEVLAPSHSELDLLKPESIQKFCGSYQNTTFDVLVNNAGINDVALIHEVTDEEIHNMIQINLAGPMMLIRGIVTNMKKQLYGRIVNIGSIWGGAGKSGRTVYAATKHGVHGVTQTLAVELAPYNVLVNTVCPGFTMTELTRKNNDEAAIREISSFIPIGRMAEPEEQAKAVMFLAGEENTYITGQQLFVDGGYISR